MSEETTNVLVNIIKLKTPAGVKGNDWHVRSFNKYLKSWAPWKVTQCTMWFKTIPDEIIISWNTYASIPFSLFFLKSMPLHCRSWIESKSYLYLTRLNSRKLNFQMQCLPVPQWGRFPSSSENVKPTWIRLSISTLHFTTKYFNSYE